MEKIYFDIPVEITNPLEEKIAKAFQVYDWDNVNMVNARDVGGILRTLGCVPSDNDIQEIVKRTEFADHPEDIHLSNFMPHLKTILYEGKMKSESPEVLLEAFKILDENNDGFIEKEPFLKIMREVGDPMTEDELANMMKTAVDPTDQRIYYARYINQLIHEPKEEDCLYKLAQEFVKPDPKLKRRFV